MAENLHSAYVRAVQAVDGETEDEEEAAKRIERLRGLADDFTEGMGPRIDTYNGYIDQQVLLAAQLRILSEDTIDRNNAIGAMQHVILGVTAENKSVTVPGGAGMPDLSLTPVSPFSGGCCAAFDFIVKKHPDITGSYEVDLSSDVTEPVFAIMPDNSNRQNPVYLSDRLHDILQTEGSDATFRDFNNVTARSRAHQELDFVVVAAYYRLDSMRTNLEMWEHIVKAMRNRRLNPLIAEAAREAPLLVSERAKQHEWEEIEQLGGAPRTHGPSAKFYIPTPEELVQTSVAGLAR